MPQKPRYGINIKEETYERLLRRKQHPNESFNDIIVRLLDNDKEGGKRDH